MPTSEYIRRLREAVGNDLLLLPSVTILTFDDHNRVLLVKHAATGMWVAPGGSIDPPDEYPADAAVREMWEETGLLVEPSRVVGVFGGPEFQITYPNQDQVSYVMIVFEAHVTGGRMEADSAEILEVGYFSQADLAALKLASWARIVLAAAFADRAQTLFEPPTWKPPASPQDGPGG
jgi:8-oxo-dGTP pyrophosphatase MutT (NUDIX family)